MGLSVYQCEPGGAEPCRCADGAARAEGDCGGLDCGRDGVLVKGVD